MLQLLGSRNFIPNWYTSRLPCGNFIPKLGCHLFFPWVSRTWFSTQMALMRFQASPTSLWGGHPTRTNKDHPATRPAFLHLSAGHASIQRLWWSCWLRGRQQEPVSAEDWCRRNLHRPKDIPKPWSIFGLLKACYNSYFHACFEFRTHHSYKWGTTEIIRLDLDAVDGPPSSASLHPPGLESLVANLVAVEVKCCDGFVDFEGGSESLSVLKTAAGETYTGRRISPSHDQSLGCWRIVRTPTFMPIYLGLRTHHGYKCGTSMEPLK